MADLFIAFDPNADPGSRLAPELVAEIGVVAPSVVLNGSITTAKMALQAITEACIYPGAVGSTEIATGGVATVNLATGAVTAAKIGTDAVTPNACAPGVVTAADTNGNPAATVIVVMTAVQYAALTTPDPNTLYFVTS